MATEAAGREFIRIFLCGDVMTGRGIDQVLQHSVDPVLHEPYIKDARDYVTSAEKAHGSIRRKVDPSYIWGDAPGKLRRRAPALRLINLETSVTTSDAWWPDKQIHYRMHPGNVDVLKAAGIDGCVLANNHVLDWGYDGLNETLDTLEVADIATVGAGKNVTRAWSPAAFPLPNGNRLLVFAFGTESAGVPPDWEARENRQGVAWLPDLSDRTFKRIQEALTRQCRKKNLIIVSIHWGGNWGYEVPARQIVFARRLIDEAGVDIVWGHSSHHPRPLEVYRDRLILYSCGDFLNDYEGIGGHEEYRSTLVLMVFPEISLDDGRLLRCTLAPMRIRRFQLQRASESDAHWLADTLNREGHAFKNTRLRIQPGGELAVEW